MIELLNCLKLPGTSGVKIGSVTYLGVAGSSDGFPTGTALSTMVGISAGALWTNAIIWHKFLIDGKTIVVANMNVRHSVSWDALNQRGLVYGTTTISISGKIYKVRLLKGDTVDPTTLKDAVTLQIANDPSEWAKTIGALMSTSYGGSGLFASLSPVDLSIGSGTGNGSWCQERSAANALIRGSPGIGGVYLRGYTEASSYRCWRPVLELVG